MSLVIKKDENWNIVEYWALDNANQGILTKYAEEDRMKVWFELKQWGLEVQIALLDPVLVWSTRHIASKDAEYIIIEPEEVTAYEWLWYETTSFAYRELDRLEQSYWKEVTWRDWGDFPIWWATPTSDRTTKLEKDRYNALINSTEYLWEVIKIIPRDFMINGDNDRSLIYRDSESNKWVSTSSNAQEIYAFVNIPVGKKATHVKINWNSTDTVSVYESNTNNWAWWELLGSWILGSEINIWEVEHTQNNFLVIEIDTNRSNDIIYWWYVKISNI